MKVKEILSSESKWCKDVAAIDINDVQTDALSPQAVRWCLLGACVLSASKEHPRNLHEAAKVTDNKKLTLMMAVKNLYPQFNGISIFNDNPGTSFEDVKKVLELADV